MTMIIQPRKFHKNRTGFVFILITILVVAGSFWGLKIYKAISAEKLATQSKDLTILNARSFPAVGGSWLTQFTTDGQADLKIEGVNGTFFEPTNTNERSDLKFLTLQCGNTEFTPARQGNSYVYPNWGCEDFGYFSDQVLTQGHHYLKFTFGDRISYAYNTAGALPWTKRLGGIGQDAGWNLAIDTNDRVLIAGSVNSSGGGGGGSIVDLSGDGDTDDANETPTDVYALEDGFVSVFDSSGTFAWSKRLGGTSRDYLDGITTDTNDRVIITGIASSTADLNGDGDTDEANETPTGGINGLGDGFVSVFDSSGTPQWSKRIGGTGDDYLYDASTDANNNVIVVGYATSTADLNGDGDTDEANEIPTSIYGGLDVIISAFNSSGTFVWSKRLGGTSLDASFELTNDSNNNVIITGIVTGTADLNGDGDTDEANETPTGGINGLGDVFISVFDSSGTFAWSKRMGGTGDDAAFTVTTDTNDNVIVAGYVNGTADLNGDGDTDEANETPTGGINGNNDIFISVFDSSGTFAWSKRIGGTSADSGLRVTTDANNQVIITGMVLGTADLNGDGDTSGTNETQSGIYGWRDTFISVFNSSGTFQWSKRMGGTNEEWGTGLAADSSNNVIVGGWVTATASDLNGDGDTSDVNETPSAIHGSREAFISKIVILPTVSAGGASSIALTSATLNGSIDDIGVTTVTARGFEWGTTASYGTTVSESDSYGVGSFSTNLTGLACGAIYYFRAYATNSQGTGYSPNTTFTASVCPNGPPAGVIDVVSTINTITPPPPPPPPQIISPDDTQANVEPSSSVTTPTPNIAPEPTPVAPTPDTVVTYIPPVVPPMATFTRGLWLGLRDPDVLKLQIVLNQNLDTLLAERGGGSPGNETDYFGYRTFQAVKNFQLKYHIATEDDPYFGYVGPNTRPKLNEIAIANGNNTGPVPIVSTPSAPAVSPQAAFTRGLWVGLRDPDVERLQIFLNQDPDTRVAESGVGSPGNETDYFDSNMLQAVKNFQLKHSVSSENDPNFGYVGPNTRAKINEIITATGN